MKVVRYAVPVLALFIVVGLIDFFARTLLRHDGINEKVRGALVFFNRTDSDIELAVKPRHQAPQNLYINSGARACLMNTTKRKLASSELLKYIIVHYADRKYKFSDAVVLNEFPSNDYELLTRYFDVIVVSSTDEAWDYVKERLGKKGLLLSEDRRYLVLSNHSKLGYWWADDAYIQIVKIK